MGIDPTLQKLPPQSIEAEEGLLSAAILDDDGAVVDIAIDIIIPENFYRTAHQIIFEALTDLHRQQKPTDLITVVDHLRTAEKLEEIGGAAYLSRIVDTVPSAVNVAHYCRIIKEKAVLRELIKKCNNISQNCYSSSPPVDILDNAQADVMSLDFNDESKTCAHISKVVENCIDEIEIKGKTQTSITGIPTSITLLDSYTAGFQNSDLIILAARPSMGKTALALQFARSCGYNNVPCSIFSLEMNKVQLGLRLIASQARVNYAKLRVGKLASYEWASVTDASAIISDMPIHIDDVSDIGIMGMRREMRRHKKEYGTGIFIIDYLQLMKVNSANGRRDLEIGDISRGLKVAAREFNVPVIALSQLNRKVEDRPDKRPRLSDLRESGALEQDADIVAFIYRDEVYNKDENNPNRGTAEVIIAKQRNGPTGIIPTAFLSSYMRFENPA